MTIPGESQLGNPRRIKIWRIVFLEEKNRISFKNKNKIFAICLLARVETLESDAYFVSNAKKLVAFGDSQLANLYLALQVQVNDVI